MTMKLKYFDTLELRDFENGSVTDEIRKVFQERDKYRAALSVIKWGTADTSSPYRAMLSEEYQRIAKEALNG